MSEKSNNTKTVLLNTLALAWELGYTIAGPLVILALAGRYLDNYLGSSPAYLLTGIVLSIIISGILIYRKVQRILKDSQD